MAAEIQARLEADTGHAIKAVCVVHNETSTGAVTRVARVRKAIDEAKHPALLLVDTISSLASIDYRHDEWGVEVMFDSGGFFVQQGKVTYDELFPKLLHQ